MEKEQEVFEFGKTNYLLIIAGVVVIGVGFILMSGGGTNNPKEFAGDQIFNSTRLTVAPITVLLGFAVVLFGIVKKPQ